MKQLSLRNFYAIKEELMAGDIEVQGEELDQLLMVGVTWDTDLMFKEGLVDQGGNVGRNTA